MPRQLQFRLLYTLPVIWLVVSTVFLLIHFVPGDPVATSGVLPADRHDRPSPGSRRGRGGATIRVAPRPGSSTRRVRGVAASPSTRRITVTLPRYQSARASDRRPADELPEL